LENRCPPAAIAHVSADGGHVQLLADHLAGVARLAGDFSEPFCDRRWGELAGRWHDLGKYASDFQEMIRAATGLDEFADDNAANARVDHSSAGAVHAMQTLGKGLGDPIACVVAGHHAGLVDREVELLPRLAVKAHRLVEALKGGPPPAILAPEVLERPACVRSGGDESARRDWELWVRMLFSALVDADSLDTEAFTDPASAKMRSGYPAMGELADRLEDYLGRLGQGRTGPVIERRQAVQESMRQESLRQPGIYTLTVPTGGGKTMASALFGLRHARQHGLKRVVIVPPFTSIIEQTAAVLRAALGDESVIEHHSALDPDRESRRAALAAENWDAPVIVTTAVQLLESLFARKRSRCRKLHNLASSVIVIDEAQTLPPELLAPVLDVLGSLVRGYGATIVLSTATQPALGRRAGFPGLDIVGELAPDPGGLADALRRVEVSWPPAGGAPEAWPALALRVAAERSALSIVHRKADARELVAALDALGLAPVHLSGNMCAAHRSQVISEIKARLREEGPLHVVSTQLVEAGVDLDFPVVFRALAGLDSLAQAAGRCNREGTRERGRLEVFLAPTSPPRGAPEAGLQVTREMLAATPGLDLFSPQVHGEFFRRLYASRDLDRHGIQALRAAHRFRAVADTFRIIEDGAVELAVPWGEGEALLAGLARGGPSRRLLRRLQRFVVRVPRRLFERLQAAGAIEEIPDFGPVLGAAFHHLYSDRFGLDPGDRPTAEPEAFVV